MGFLDPNWRPDPSGRRIVAIRSARRGAAASALIFGPLEVLAIAVGLSTAQVDAHLDVDTGLTLVLALVVTAFSFPALALLGAGLTSAALGTRSSAISAGVALGVGVPVAAVTSAVIGAFVVVSFAGGAGEGTAAAGVVIRTGVNAASRIWPFIVVGAATWVLVVRRFAGPLAVVEQDVDQPVIEDEDRPQAGSPADVVNPPERGPRHPD
jgi:hypothetical protein